MVFAFGFQNLLFINSAEEEGRPNVFTFVGYTIACKFTYIINIIYYE